ncbi:MAG: restriction endonuclease [Chloroflexota bacterium]
MSVVLRRKIKERLQELSPRAFEFFAGDLLEYLGLASVRVTRQTGDGGIDAECELVSGNLFHVPAGVQVKRQRRPVYRPEIDRFIGALANRYSYGIFITTANFSETSLQKSAKSIPYISTIDGDQVADVLIKNEIGIQHKTNSIDEDYFGMFEGQLRVAERPASYDVRSERMISTDDDLISLRALSYALRVDTTTIRRWVERGKIKPDSYSDQRAGDGLFFRRRCIQEARQKFKLRPDPVLNDEWLGSFLRFAMRGLLNKSYKPVMLLAMFDNVNSDGTINENTLVESFRAFYVARSKKGLQPEVSSSLLSRPESASLSDVRKLLIRYPLDRFIIQGFIEHLPEEGLIRFRPELWEGLHFQDVLALRDSLRKQLDRYFSTLNRKG